MVYQCNYDPERVGRAKWPQVLNLLATHRRYHPLCGGGEEEPDPDRRSPAPNAPGPHNPPPPLPPAALPEHRRYGTMSAATPNP